MLLSVPIAIVTLENGVNDYLRMYNHKIISTGSQGAFFTLNSIHVMGDATSLKVQ